MNLGNLLNLTINWFLIGNFMLFLMTIKECPKDWVELKATVSCYKFIRYPLLNVNDAKRRCAVSLNLKTN